MTGHASAIARSSRIVVGWVVLGTLAQVSAQTTAATPADASTWAWTVVPYLWGAGVSLDVSANDEPVFGGDLSFEDLLDKLDVAGMLHFEGRAGKAGFFVDGLYMSLSDSATSAPNPPLLPDGADVDSELSMGKYEAAGFYRLSGDQSWLNVFLGVRVVDYEAQVDVTRSTPTPAATSLGTADTFLNGFIGARFGFPFAERWQLQVRGDVGTGDTDLSWTATAGVGVWFGKNRKFGLDLLYQHFAIEIENSSGPGLTVESDVSFSGPGLGFAIRF